MQTITFKDKQPLQAVVNNPKTKKTTLTQWLKNNQIDDSGRHLTYLDYLSEYNWIGQGKDWSRRVSNKAPAIGRLIYIHPTCGDLFYLRMLLSQQVGCQTFNDIKKVGDVVFPTYRAACEKLGLLGDDKEWSYAFDDASAWATSEELRYLFAHMLLFCDVADPVALWTQQWRRMSDNIVQRAAADSHVINLHVNDVDLQHYVLYELEILLNSNSNSSSLSDYGLPMPPPRLLAELKNRLLMEERNYDRVSLRQQNEISVSKLNSEQQVIYETVIKASSENNQELIFVYGHGGTGKTFLWTTVISALRSAGKIVLAVASSGIASLLLPSGRTTHSRFKIPLDLTNDSVCHIKKNTQLARLLFETALIIWDEAPMTDRKCFEALDKSLKDILDKPTHPFGGKWVLLGGDFRQTLPVKPKGTKKDIIASSIAESPIWSHFKVCKLSKNMRLLQTNLSLEEKEEIATFSSWLLQIGDGPHSRFKIPLDLTNDSVCHIKKNTQLARLLFETALIIWDEAPMTDRKCFEALDKSLKDILDKPTHPFGGKWVLLGGDFRQTLPVKPKGTKKDIIASSIAESPIWSHFKVCKLSKNMRLLQTNLSLEEKEEIATFSSWLLQIGDGPHSRFKIPLDLTNDSVCHIKKNTQLARLLFETALIIWDEAPMTDRKCFEALDKSLKDILDKPTHPFGGKWVLLGGDFRQTLPVKPKGTKKDIIASSIAESPIWSHFKVCKLSKNMRLLQTNLSLEEKEEIATFSSWLLQIGDGHLGVDDEDDPTDIKWVEIPEKYLIPDHEDTGVDLVRFIYDADILHNPTATMFSDKAIVCPKNETADEINSLILCSLSGKPTVYLSVDSIIPHANDKGDTEVLYPSEYLNLLNFSGFPTHHLELKVGVPIMLLRNMNQMEGLCNGTRMIITQLLQRVIQAEVITGVRIGHKVYIPRITLNHDDKELPFVFKRKQFPVRVYYAMTINKSQGQSLNKIGIYLPQPIFSHGQLYVALSRATSATGLKILIKTQPSQPSHCTKNIVFSDFLTKLKHAQIQQYDTADGNNEP